MIIYENNRIEGNSVIEDNVTIFPNCFICNSIIGKGSKIYTSVIQNAKIGVCSSVGPFSHIKKSVLGEYVKLGAFTEIKTSELKKGTSVASGSVVCDNSKINNLF